MNLEGRDRRLVFWLVAGVSVLAFVVLMWPFLPALCWAGAISVLMFPMYTRMRKRWHPNFSALFVTLVAGTLIILPFVAVGTVAGVSVYGTLQDLRADEGSGRISFDMIAAEVDARMLPITQQLGVQPLNTREWVDEHREDLTRNLAEPVALGARAAITTILTLIFSIIATFFFIRDGHLLLKPTLEIIPLPHEESLRILESVRKTIHSVFVGIILVAFLQGSIATGMYWAVGIDGWVLWGALTIMLCMIPLLGSPLVYLPLAASLALEGKYWNAFALAIVGLIVISNVDNALRPFVISAKCGLHPLGIFFSVLGGVLLMGPIGIMVGPVVLTLVIAFADVLRVKGHLAEQAHGSEPGSATV